jgi:RNA polymerase sigma factor (sigma-70 family)
MLREDFEGLRGRVLASVRTRLRASGMSLDQGDLEACYATAWQGLYAAVLEGQEIANPSGWLVLVTFRRAIEEQRSHTRIAVATDTQGAGEHDFASEHDFAAELDDRVRLRQLFEALRGRLDGREREAATLCYLQGLSRAEAAMQMGVSEARMRKLMEGRGPGRPGVAGKVGALVQSIRDGDWCDEQGSLMRALAYGILDPDGERYQLARLHHSQCPSCRAYVTSLRGLAAALPPIPLPLGIGIAAVAGASGAAGAAGAGAGGAAGGGWLMGAGSLGAKLAVGCVLALSVGAGCVALDGAHPPHVRRHPLARMSTAHVAASSSTTLAGQLAAGLGGSGSAAASAALADASAALTPSARVSREFGPEQALASSSSAGAAGASRASPARAASSGTRASRSAGEPAAGSSSEGEASASAGAGSAGQPAAGDSSSAEREFSPG